MMRCSGGKHVTLGLEGKLGGLRGGCRSVLVVLAVG